jgi:hypothetical protein
MKPIRFKIAMRKGDLGVFEVDYKETEGYLIEDEVVVHKGNLGVYTKWRLSDLRTGLALSSKNFNTRKEAIKYYRTSLKRKILTYKKTSKYKKSLSRFKPNNKI